MTAMLPQPRSCLMCPMLFSCPYALPGATCAYADPVPSAQAQHALRRAHLFRSIAAAVAFAGLVISVAGVKLW